MAPLEQGAFSRRRFLAGLGGLTGAAAAGLVTPRRFLRSTEEMLEPAAPEMLAAFDDETPVPLTALRQAPPEPAFERVPGPNHLAWVWKFDYDGDPAEVRDTLAEHGLGIALKTHDGIYWMSRYDRSRTSVSGPAAVERFANFFEQGGVPFHAWTVVKGRNTRREAQLASDVLSAGARSIFLDLEAHDKFWVGTDEDAERFGEELRRLQPSARLSTSIDPRPWELGRIPLPEFAAFSDEIAPQTYWGLFSSTANVRLYRESGEAVPRGGITPGFVLSTTVRHLAGFGLPIHPIGDGTVADTARWGEFLKKSQGVEVETVSVWRYGVTDPAIWGLLRDMPPGSVAG
jgi:hypothetical protein